MTNLITRAHVRAGCGLVLGCVVGCPADCPERSGKSSPIKICGIACGRAWATGGTGIGTSKPDINFVFGELPIWAKTVPYTRTKTVCIYTPAGSTLILYVDSRNVKTENFFT